MAETNRESVLTQYADDRNLLPARPSTGSGRSRWTSTGGRCRWRRLDGDERLADVGCGNGNYLRALAAAGHRGPVMGVDLSAGMGPHAVGDVASLPLRSASADVALCMHVLYHLPDQAAGAAELRRIVRPGGQALLVTNSVDHVREMDDLAAEIAGARPARAMYSFTMETGDEVLRTAFESVEAHHLRGRLVVTEAEAVVSYVASAPEAYGADDRRPRGDP